MARQRSALRLLAGVVAAYAAAWGLYRGAQEWTRPVRLETSHPAYFRDEFVEIRLRTRDGALRSLWEDGPAPRVAVARDGRPVTTIAGVVWLDLAWDGRERAFVARWPCPWNAPAGRYELELAGAGELGDRLRRSGFELRRRTPKPLPPGFVALTLETSKPLAELRVAAPDGTEKGWRGLLDWAEYLEADAFWMLVGDTPGGNGEVWRSENLPLIPEIAKEAAGRGLALGVYAKCYLTASTQPAGGYEYAWDVEEGKPKRTRAISLKDPRRPGDVARLLKDLARIPGVEHIGLDYIRNALGGYELIEEFFAEMPGVKPPPEWPQLDARERMVWFHRKKVMRRDPAFIDAWQWWRAHRVGRIVREIRAALPDKTLWAFSLTWEKGWHHGQDPVMMNDAGIDANALMLYEADAEQFELILRDLSAYLASSDSQLVVGDVVDWPLHQKAPPAELRRRLAQATRRIYSDGRPPAGLFVHDVGRALWGRLGPHSTMEWLEEARGAVRDFRERAREAGMLEPSRSPPRAGRAAGRLSVSSAFKRGLE